MKAKKMTKRTVKFRIGRFLSINREKNKLNFQLNENWKGDILNLCIGILSSLIFMEQEGMVLSSGFDAKVKQITLNL